MQNEFEKQVQQKMEELDLVPSPPVWEKIEEQIHVKRDRWKAIIWFSLLALLLTVGVYWMLQADGVHTFASKVSPASRDLKKSTDADITVENKTIGQDENNVDLKKEVPDNKTTCEIRNEENRVEKEKQKQKDKEVKVEAERMMKPINGSQPIQKNDLKRNKEQSNKTKIKGAAVAGTILLDQKPGIVKQNTLQQSAKKQSTKQPADKEFEQARDSVHTNPSTPAKTSIDTAAKKATLNAVVVNTGKPSELPVIEQEDANINETGTAATATGSKASGKKSKWNFGIMASAGVSGITEDLSSLFATEKLYADQGLQTTTSFRGPYARSYAPPSSVKNNFGFSLGVLLKKLIGKKLKFSTGIQYDYYSTLLESGRKDSIMLLVSNMNNGNLQLVNAGSGFSNFTNSFHFITIPAAVEFQVFKKLPVNVTGGLSIQQLIKANALEYNGKTHLYDYNTQHYQKTEVFSSFGLNYTIVKAKTSWVIGPEIKYGISKLETSNAGHHLFSAEIKAQVVFEKK
ncbi:MAG: hypothetical protein ACJ749_04775 [Flavisolibacter sp.]